MKEPIQFNADAELQGIIQRWLLFLKDERRYSTHTLDAYARDLALFINYFETTLTLSFLKNLEIRDFRGFISARAAKNIEFGGRADCHPASRQGFAQGFRCFGRLRCFKRIRAFCKIRLAGLARSRGNVFVVRMRVAHIRSAFFKLRSNRFRVRFFAH